jgi:hypothetical protein
MFEEIPIPVKLISILDYMSAFACVAVGILFLSGYDIIKSNLELIIKEVPSLGILTSDLPISEGIILVVSGVFLFFIARGLWNGRNWARYLEILLAIFGFLISLFFVYLGENIFIFNLFVHGLIGSYFLLNRDVREAFY